jgi:YfiH family protein
MSRAPFDSFNLGDHVGDDPAAVAHNRARLAQALALPATPLWLTQTHGVQVVNAAKQAAESRCEADACHTDQPGAVCVVLTADCLPIVLCDRAGTHVAAVHAGWRGLAAGVIETAVAALGKSGAELMAWLGPAIGPAHFEVGEDVRECFLRHDPHAAQAFAGSPRGRYYADIYQLARLRLAQCDVASVWGGQYCTYGDTRRFYSYRRDGVTGRMATLIWLE